MFRRLYFMFPSPETTHKAVIELVQNGVREKQMHALAREGIDLSGLPPSTEQQRRGLRDRLAQLLWNVDLILFALALAGLIFALFYGSIVGVIIAVVIMVATFLGGVFYTFRIPDITLAEFKEALAHGEVLLLMDVPRRRVAKIEEIIHRHHPSAAAGGSSWIIDAFDM